MRWRPVAGLLGNIRKRTYYAPLLFLVTNTFSWYSWHVKLAGLDNHYWTAIGTTINPKTDFTYTAGEKRDQTYSYLIFSTMV